MRSLASEIFKTNNNPNSSFMKEIFGTKINRRIGLNDMIVTSHNTAASGDKSLTTLNPLRWNSL